MGVDRAASWWLQDLSEWESGMAAVSTVPGMTAFEQAQAAYSGTIRTFARNAALQLRGAGYLQEDIEAELLIELWKCVEKYDPNKGAKFNTLFQGCAKNRIISLVRRANTQMRKANVYSLSDEDVAFAVEQVFNSASTEDEVLARFAIDEYDAEEILRAITLSPAERHAVEMRTA